MLTDEFIINQGEICFLAGISDIASYFGIKINEPFVLAMSSGLQFCCGYVEKHKKDNWVQRSENTRLSTYCTDLLYDFDSFVWMLGKINLSIESIKTNCYDTAIKNIKNMLEHDMPVLIEVDIFYLDYHMDFMKKHDAHTIIVYGLDEEKQVCHVGDNYITTLRKSHYQGTIPLNNFVKALNLSQTKGNCDYLMWNITPNGSEKAKGEISAAEIIQKVKESGLNTRLSKTIKGKTFGIAGMHVLRNALTELYENGYNDEAHAACERLHKQITGFGGAIPSRNLYSKFLDWTIQSMDFKYSDNVVDLCNDSVEIWKIVANILLKCDFRRNMKYLDRAILELDSIIKNEKALAEALCGVDAASVQKK